jgi:hypothetical protein
MSSGTENGIDFKIDENHFNSFKSNPEFTSLLSELELYNVRFRNLPIAQRELALYLILNNKTDVVSDLESLLYKRHVPTIQEFLTEEYLPGHPITAPGNIWKEELIEIFNPSKSYYEHILTGCFSEETEIFLSNGSFISFKELIDRNIKEIEIISFDKEKQQYVKTKAINPRITKNVDEILELEFDDGYKVRCTPDHRFLTKNRGWVEAQDLNEEDELEHANAVVLKIKSKKIIKLDKPKYVYDLSVPETHNFCLKNKTVVHNSIGCAKTSTAVVSQFYNLFRLTSLRTPQLTMGCFSDDTEILLSDGSFISFKELIDNNIKEIKVISFDEKKQKYIKTLAIKPRITKYVDELLELEFEDGYKVKCTSDHKFLTMNRGWVEAQDLKEEDTIRDYNFQKEKDTMT